MAAIGEHFFGVVEGQTIVWYGNIRPSVSDLTPTIYANKYLNTDSKSKKKKPNR
jgi:hypothetical protein